MPHAIWKGAISFGLVTVPVSLHTAEDKRELSFHMLDGADMSPILNQRVNAATGEEVPYERIVKGYEVDKGRWVVVTDEDFRAADVEATQTIDIIGFVPAGSIGPEWFDKPYHLEPMKPGRKAYALLRETLERSSRVGVARVVIRTRQHIAALVPRGDELMLLMLRWAHELRSAEGLDLPSEDEAELADAELKMAETLVSSMASEWDPAAYTDTYRDRLLAAIREKAETGKTAEVAPPTDYEHAEVVDIMDLLRKSVDERKAAGG